MGGAGRETIALYGGTFDPFHVGHLRMAIEVRELLGLSRVTLLPARVPPHKPDRPVTGALHRLAMVRAGTEGLPGIDVSDAEILREGPSYSLVTVREFRRASPGAEILFVIGADAFAEIPSWYRYEELLAECDFLLLPRPGGSGAAPGPPALRIEKETPHCYSWKGEAYRLPGGRRLLCPVLPALEVSSSAIRESVRAGRCIRGLVPPAVERYIEAHGLYAFAPEEQRP